MLCQNFFLSTYILAWFSYLVILCNYFILWAIGAFTLILKNGNVTVCQSYSLHWNIGGKCFVLHFQQLCYMVLSTASEQYFSCFWFELFFVVNGLFRMLVLPGPSLNLLSWTTWFLAREGGWSPMVPLGSSGLCRGAHASGCCLVGFAAAVRGPSWLGQCLDLPGSSAPYCLLLEL